MSLRSIKDPEERDDMVKDYLATVKRIKKRNSAENSRIMEQTQDLETTFEPVVRSNKEMAQDISKDLAPITEGLQEINRNMVKIEARPNWSQAQDGNTRSSDRTIHAKLSRWSQWCR